MTAITITSDLHIDFWVKSTNSEEKQKKMMRTLFDKLMPDDASDILIIAGDIGHYNMQNKYMFEVLRESFAEVYWTYGNHDLYLVSNSLSKKYGHDSFARLDEMVALSDAIDGVHFLDGDSVETRGIKIGGVACWYDRTYAQREWNMSDAEIDHSWLMGMTDSQLIKSNGNTIDYADYAERVNQKVESLVDCDVIFSHIAPDYSNLLDEYKEPFTTFYHFDGTKYLDRMKQDSMWIFGHTHSRYFYQYDNKVTMIASPLGYTPPGYDSTHTDVSSRQFLTMDVGPLKTYEELWNE